MDWSYWQKALITAVLVAWALMVVWAFYVRKGK